MDSTILKSNHTFTNPINFPSVGTSNDQLLNHDCAKARLRKSYCIYLNTLASLETIMKGAIMALKKLQIRAQR